MKRFLHRGNLTTSSFSDGSCENDPYQEGGGMGDYPPSPESWIGEGMENAPPGQGNNLGHMPPSAGPGGPPPYE